MKVLAGLDRSAELGPQAAKRIASAFDYPLMTDDTVDDAITHVDVHDAHHVRQIVTLRHIHGRWPSPSGGWTR